ncbi:MAG: helix-turn-helix domain-containing protein [Fusobacteriaceae bacterium]
MPRNNKKIVEERRKRVSDLYLQGYAQYVIAEKVGVTQSQVSYDLKVLQRYWQIQSLENIDSIKQRELKKVDFIENEYFEQWQKSKEVTENNLAISNYMQGVERCLELRMKIIGYKPAEKIESKTEITGFNIVVSNPDNQNILNGL